MQTRCMQPILRIANNVQDIKVQPYRIICHPFPPKNKHYKQYNSNAVSLPRL